MHYKVVHTTNYKYAARVTHCYNLANLIPKNTVRQKCLNSKITVSPKPIHTNKRIDYFGNQSYQFEIQTAHTDLIIRSESQIEIQETSTILNLELGMNYGDALNYFKQAPTFQVIKAKEFILDSPMIKTNNAIEAYARPSFSLTRPLNSCVTELTKRIFDDFNYTPGYTTIATPLSEVLEHKRGVCQDFAHLQIACLRAMGIPAKYVSGYMETLPPPGQKKLVGADATHAWVAYFSPEEGWIEYDPTNNLRSGNQHIVTAEGRDYYDVTPIKGVIFGGGKGPLLEISVDVSRILKD
ncbi:MAG: transglutaminase-like putative cysteine protease [Oleiphilaceae bacterium]|jgi:transglutaminase-like putative cysteine protease